MGRRWRILIVLALTAVFVSLVGTSALAKGPSEACLNTMGHTQVPAFCDSSGGIEPKWFSKVDPDPGG